MDEMELRIAELEIGLEDVGERLARCAQIHEELIERRRREILALEAELRTGVELLSSDFGRLQRAVDQAQRR